MDQERSFVHTSCTYHCTVLIAFYITKPERIMTLKRFQNGFGRYLDREKINLSLSNIRIISKRTKKKPLISLFTEING